MGDQARVERLASAMRHKGQGEQSRRQREIKGGRIQAGLPRMIHVGTGCVLGMESERAYRPVEGQQQHEAKRKSACSQTGPMKPAVASCKHAASNYLLDDYNADPVAAFQLLSSSFLP